ncbi:MAG: hypothetical protein ACX93P_00815 [Roseovarius sp.]
MRDGLSSLCEMTGPQKTLLEKVFEGVPFEKLGKSLVETVLAYLTPALVILLDGQFQILGGEDSFLYNPEWKSRAHTTALSICFPIAFLLSFYLKPFSDGRLLKWGTISLILFCVSLVLCMAIYFGINYIGRDASELAQDVWMVSYILAYLLLTVSGTAYAVKYIG